MHQWPLLEAAQNVDLANIRGKAGKEQLGIWEMMSEVTQMLPYLTSNRIGERNLQRSGYLEALDGAKYVRVSSSLRKLGRIFICDTRI